MHRRSYQKKKKPASTFFDFVRYISQSCNTVQSITVFCSLNSNKNIKTNKTSKNEFRCKFHQILTSFREKVLKCLILFIKKCFRFVESQVVLFVVAMFATVMAADNAHGVGQGVAHGTSGHGVSHGTSGQGATHGAHGTSGHATGRSLGGNSHPAAPASASHGTHGHVAAPAAPAPAHGSHGKRPIHFINYSTFTANQNVNFFPPFLSFRFSCKTLELKSNGSCYSHML